MTGIYFVGSPNPFYNVENRSSIINADCLVCVNSEYELETAMLVEKHGVRGISITAALNCINRLMFRLALVGTGLNPEFHPIELTPGVLKLSSSAQNSGVVFVPEDTYSDLPAQIQTHFPELARIGVWEERLYGDFLEVSGYIVNGIAYYKEAKLQTWNAKSNRIIKYEKIELEKIPTTLLDTAFKRLGLDYTFFCAEMVMLDDGVFKLIEVNHRLGEDNRIVREDLEAMVEEFVQKFYEE